MKCAGAPPTLNPLGARLKTVPGRCAAGNARPTSGRVTGMLLDGRRRSTGSETSVAVVGDPQRASPAPPARPHGLTRLGSVMRATPGMSETRLRFV